MAITTFSGPVRSLAGFITGTDVNSTVTAATGSKAVYTFIVATAVTSNSNVIQVANSTDTMNGLASVGGATAAIFGTLPASDTITMNGGTTGGLVGSYVQITDLAAGEYLVSAALVGSGTPATPFSAAV